MEPGAHQAAALHMLEHIPATQLDQLGVTQHDVGVLRNLIQVNDITDEQLATLGIQGDEMPDDVLRHLLALLRGPQDQQSNVAHAGRRKALTGKELLQTEMEDGDRHVCAQLSKPGVNTQASSGLDTVFVEAWDPSKTALIHAVCGEEAAAAAVLERRCIRVASYRAGSCRN